MEVLLETGRGVFEVLAHVCRSPLEALRQFVENAADTIEQVGRKDGVIRLRLLHDKAGALREIVVEDNGTGMSLEKMELVLRTIGHSDKAKLALRGEKGIGILAFALVAQELHLSSCPQEGTPSACLVLGRGDLGLGKGNLLSPCPYHKQEHRGTTAHLMDILPEAANSLSREHLKGYLGREFATDLRQSLYSLLLEDNGRCEPVQPQRLRGLQVMSLTIPLNSSGHAAVELHVLPAEAPDAAVNLYGRGGIRICDLASLAPFQRHPWLDKRLEGYVRCDKLKRTADKAAVVQDKVYWDLVAALQAVEPRLKQDISRVAQEHLERRVGRVLRRVDFLVERFVRYLEEGTPLRAPALREHRSVSPAAPVLRVADVRRPAAGRRSYQQPLHFTLAAPEPAKEDWQSWGNGGQEVVQVNRTHTDFLEAEQDDVRCARYLFSLWAKEHLLTEYGSDARRVAEEMVSWLNKVDPLLARSH